MTTDWIERLKNAPPPDMTPVTTYNPATDEVGAKLTLAYATLLRHSASYIARNEGVNQAIEVVEDVLRDLYAMRDRVQ